MRRSIEMTAAATAFAMADARSGSPVTAVIDTVPPSGSTVEWTEDRSSPTVVWGTLRAADVRTSVVRVSRFPVARVRLAALMSSGPEPSVLRARMVADAV
jgi:hypothetical protein